jgi:hypothetical protein
MSDDATDALERDWYNSAGIPDDVIIRKQEPIKYEFKRIVRETDKSWLLEMSGGAMRWHSKKYCWLENGMVFVPKWLDDKIWAGLWAELEKQMDSGCCVVKYIEEEVK